MPPHPKDENLRKIRLVGRAKWKRLIGYHRRSIAKTTMFRLKTAFDGKVTSRGLNRQVNELKVQCLVLNRMIQSLSRIACLLLPSRPRKRDRKRVLLFVIQSYIGATTPVKTYIPGAWCKTGLPFRHTQVG
ncbi:MAG: hypothetical protein WA885_05415 [Phormidesmis sp.]